MSNATRKCLHKPDIQRAQNAGTSSISHWRMTLSLSLRWRPHEDFWKDSYKWPTDFMPMQLQRRLHPWEVQGHPQGQTAKPVWSKNWIATALWELFGTLVHHENENVCASQRTSHAIWCDSSNSNSAAPFSAPKVWFCRPQAIARSWLIWLHRTAQYEVVVLLPHRHDFSTRRSSWSCQGLACQVVLWDLRLLVVWSSFLTCFM